MHRVTVKGRVTSISEDVQVSKSGFCKKLMVVEDPEGNLIAPEFHPRNFTLMEDLKEGDSITAKCRIRMNKTASANFLVVDEMTKD